MNLVFFPMDSESADVFLINVAISITSFFLIFLKGLATVRLRVSIIALKLASSLISIYSTTFCIQRYVSSINLHNKQQAGNKSICTEEMGKKL